MRCHYIDAKCLSTIPIGIGWHAPKVELSQTTARRRQTRFSPSAATMLPIQYLQMFAPQAVSLLRSGVGTDGRAILLIKPWLGVHRRLAFAPAMAAPCRSNIQYLIPNT